MGSSPRPFKHIADLVPHQCGTTLNIYHIITISTRIKSLIDEILLYLVVILLVKLHLTRSNYVAYRLDQAESTHRQCPSRHLRVPEEHAISLQSVSVKHWPFRFGCSRPESTLGRVTAFSSMHLHCPSTQSSFPTVGHIIPILAQSV